MTETSDDPLRRALDLHLAGRQNEAAVAYSAILQAEPDCADAWHLLGLIAGEKNQEETALSLVGKALDLNPANATYHHNYAGIQGRVGNLTETIEHYREAIRLKSDYSEAYYNLANTVRVPAGDPMIDAMMSLLVRPDLSPADRCFLHFALGKSFTDLADHDCAFTRYSQGNADKGLWFDHAAWERRIDDTIEAFGDTVLSAAAPGVVDERPVFIVGMPRSGTSLVEQVLAGHPEVFGAGELRYIGATADRLAEHGPGDEAYPRCVPGIDGAAYAGFAGTYLNQITALAPTAARIVDKNRLNYEHLGLIARLLPSARIIHYRRDPRDVAVSCFFQNFTTGQEWSFDLADIGIYFRAYRRLMDHWGDVLPLPVMAVDYEDMVGDFEATARRLVDFIGLAWNPACLAFHTAERAVRTASQWQVRQPVYRRSAGRSASSRATFTGVPRRRRAR